MGIACSPTQEEKSTGSAARVEEAIQTIKNQYAPDKRVAIFAVETHEQGTDVVLTGETDNPRAKQTLLRSLRDDNIAYVDSINTLPDVSIR